MKVFTAHVRTEASDHYVWVYSTKPTHEQVVERLMEFEGAGEEDRGFYIDTTSVKIEEQEVVDL